MRLIRLAKPLSCVAAAFVACVLGCEIWEFFGWNVVYVDLPLHAAFETLGASAGLALALCLAEEEKLGRRRDDGSLALAVGFLAMGIFGAFHAASIPGGGFVLLHSTAGLAGGLCFAAVWAPSLRKSRSPRVVDVTLAATALLCGSIGIFVLLKRDACPAFTYNGKFTSTALAVNAAAGALFLAFAARAALRRGRGAVERDIPPWIGALLSASYLCFFRSNIWDLCWWFWHVLQAAAFVFAAVYALRRHRSALRARVRALEAEQRAEEELRELNRSLERKIDERSLQLRAVVGKLSHEFKTPLASILGFAQTLRRGAVDDSANRMEFLRIIEDNAVTLTDSVEHILEFSARGSRSDRPAAESIELAPFLHELTARLAPLAGELDLSIEQNVPSGPRVFVGRQDLYAMLQNLCVNAIKYNRPKGRVRVEAREENGEVTLSISDTGHGIPADDLPRIFEPFYRGAAHRSRVKGSGLGLCIVKDLAEHAGGSIRVESVAGAGTTFWLTLPAPATVGGNSRR